VSLRAAAAPATRVVAQALAAAAVAALAACHPRTPPPDLSLDPAALLAEVRSAQLKVASVQGRARVSVDTDDGGGGTEQYLVAERPGRVRLEAHDFFGNVVLLLAVEQGHLALYDARARTFYRGAATPAHLARLLPIPITPEELVTLACGSAPLLDGAPTGAEPGDGRVALTLRRGDEVQRLEIGPGAVILASRLSRGEGGREVPDGLQADFSVHRTRAGLRVPTDVAARVPAARVAFTLHWRELEVNGKVDPALFRLEPPAGARVVDLDAPPP
jgi:hypothetical protein